MLQNNPDQAGNYRLQARQDDLALIPRAEVQRLTGMSRAWVYQAMAERRFPRPVACSKGALRWVLGEVREWVRQRIKERDACQ